MLKHMDYQVLVEMLTELLNRLHYCQLKRVTNRSILILFATAHYSYDWAQNVHVPHSDQQVSKIYYLSPRKVHLFGIQDEAVREQINYVLDEDEIIGKGPNGTLSLVFDGIKKLNKGEKHLKVTCDNAGGQNKNNATI